MERNGQSQHPDKHTEQTLVALTARDAAPSQQGIPYFFGISRNSTGARGIAMHLVEIPPGTRADPHIHRDMETAIYVLAGRVETRYGEGLRESVINEAGSFLFIPPGVPHQPINLSATEPARAVIARNHADEQEDAVPYAPSLDTPQPSGG
jgi:uncharacterized RmlC-like cupin family protein